MIDVKRAMLAVTQHLDAMGSLVPRGEPRLEEFDYDPDREEWTLTLSFDDPFGAQRIYRSFTVDQNERVLSMKIRQLMAEPS